MSPKVRIGDIAKVGAGQGAPQDPSAFSDEGYPFIRAGSLDALCIGGDIRSLERISEARAKRHRMKLYQKSTVVFAKSGMSATKNRVFVLPEQAYVVSHLATLEVKPHVDPTWLQYFWEHYCPGNLIQDPAYPSISLEAISNVEIDLPPLPEQKRIAAILAKADRLRRLRRTARDLSDTYLQSVFLEMFGDPVSNPMGWESVDFGEVISIISGHGFKRAEYSDNGVRLLQIANVSFQEIIWGTLAYLPSNYIECYPKLVLRPGDLLMALNRPILGHRVKFAILKEEDCPAILYQRVGKFVIEAEKLNRDYLYGFMLTDYYFRQLEVRLAGSDQPYINPTELVKMRFLLPPLSLQQQFARVVHKFERLRAQQREAERQAEHLFQTLLPRAFIGEL